MRVWILVKRRSDSERVHYVFFFSFQAVQLLQKQLLDLSEQKQRERVEEAKFQVVEQARVPPPLFSAARLLSSLAFLEEKARELNHAELPTFRATLYEAKAYAQHPSLGKMVLRALGPKEDEDVAKKFAAVNLHPPPQQGYGQPPPHQFAPPQLPLSQQFLIPPPQFPPPQFPPPQFPPPQFPPPQQFGTQFYPQQVPVHQMYQPQPPPHQLVPHQLPRLR
ncbi:Hypp8234 [Branchiostoma lanceolatum]|uniref:Hypp8234 protein n=1 Tax=Branchiostoma lanceolatum TaxID=7740 RepID=A0A8J9Z6A6_BRALA|nr:Hypp8234 [Branchiostoma lanceolatum]